MRLSTALLLVLLLPVFASSAWAQQAEKRLSLNWHGQATLYAPGREVAVPTFDGAAFPAGPAGQRLPRYTFRIDGYVTEVQLPEVVFGAFTPQEAKAYASATLPTVVVPELRYGYEKHRTVTLVSITPVRRSAQSGQPEKLTSFSYTYTLGTAPQARRGTRVYAPNSVLNQGEWYKIGIAGNVAGGSDGSGIYKLSKAFLQGLGVPVQSLNPRNLQLYGNALGMLPQANNIKRPDDLTQNPLLFVGNPDNTFDDNEYFLMYGRGPHTWVRDAATPTQFRHVLNLYADTAYYFLTVGNSAGLRVAAAPAVSGTPTATIRQSVERQFYELELTNLLHSGRQWLGEGFNNGTQKEVRFAVSDLVPNSALQLTTSVAATALPRTCNVYPDPNEVTTFRLQLNGSTLQPQDVYNLSCGSGCGLCYPEAANTSIKTQRWTIPASAPSDIRVGLTYDGRGDQTASGYLDYVELQAQRNLTLSSGQLGFRSLENIAPGAVSTFTFSNLPAGATVWDVTDPRKPQEVALTGNSFVARTDTVREYVAFAGSSFDSPRGFGRVANQNLHAMGKTPNSVNLVIVTHPLFKAEAEKLAAHRRQHDNLATVVVTTNQIYNEFSSGGQDVSAIRDFVKMLYDRNNDNLYVLLFGDASYDYKSDPSNDPNQVPKDWWSKRPIKDSENQNFVPTYESQESFARIYPTRANGSDASYCSDDYFGILDDEEGAWPDNYTGDLMDAAVGRLPVRTPKGKPTSTEMAATVVNKLIDYDKPAAQGKWRNRLTFVADDGNFGLHTGNSEAAANGIASYQPAFNDNRVYLALYPQQSTAGGQRSAETNAALDAAIEQGSLFVGYAGHGGPRGWTDEQILSNASVLQLQNHQRLTFMFTGTCDFAWYDDPLFNSAGEQVLTDTEGGAIGLLTTTRLADAGYSQALALQFYPALFNRNPTTGRWPRLGDAVIAGKNNDGVDVNNRNYALLGDPSMRLAMPELSAQVRKINGRNLAATPPDTIRALQRIQLEGDVTNSSGVASTFNGTVQVTVYEKPTKVQTLGDEGDPIVSIPVQKDVVYDGQASVTNGRFKVDFVVPKDINYQFGIGKISLYAADPTQNIDAHGYHGINVGGAAATALSDTIPPVISLAMDTEGFVFGGLTRPNTTLLASLSDDSGINTAGTGIGHELTATLDGDPSKLTVLNEYYTADVDKFTSGRVRYLFKGLTTGPHALKVKAWDTFNNSAERTVEFVVAKDEKLAIEHVLNYPNPFATHTTFHFDHNRPGEALDVQVQIFTVSGKLVRTLSAVVPASQSHVKDVEWNGRDEYNDQLARGVYVYRVSVRTGSSQVSKFEKLVLLN
ncbi:type IX secretion system sortase PorU [Hymenobacter busanensis]|uniref:Type IX secretion system sortase PorU n=1 Tax=Hymenobacter busanensis TaxID=2607656 RepID=A0A7L4ZY27_9BACT|nr:type IX secretion system sortase PorU [Hymenobacter busanensis]KAA9325272.1 type IX secretion system sortase PorU [Hymenobacter busanensis]QHJ07735.1 type IX secretion system sortase PorU [Hymenobacter busanensis]